MPRPTFTAPPMPTLLAALLIGVVAGLRSMTAPAAVAWGAAFGWVPLDGTWAGFLARPVARWIFTALALGELVGDKLPTTPSRKAVGPFAGRVASGAFCGAALGAARGATVTGAVAGAVGAVLGTLGGYEARTRLAASIGGRDTPIALLEDVVAIAAAFGIVAAVR